jgi:hypothetical protein
MCIGSTMLSLAQAVTRGLVAPDAASSCIPGLLASTVALLVSFQFTDASILAYPWVILGLGWSAAAIAKQSAANSTSTGGIQSGPWAGARQPIAADGGNHGVARVAWNRHEHLPPVT